MSIESIGRFILLSVLIFNYAAASTLQTLSIPDTILEEILKCHHDFNITKQDIQAYNEGRTHQDMNLNATQLIKKYGFNVERYTVVTPDKYVLQVFRIPGPGPVVFLMHGFLSSADDFLTSGLNSGLGFLLAQQGYDVWLGNARGNKYSERNLVLNSTQPEFWDFSWHEIGIYDLPAMIDLVLEKTNTTSLIYMGHSQGTTAFFVLCSLFPEYNAKIKLMIALSAVAWISHTPSPIRILKPVGYEIGPTLNAFGIYSAFSNPKSTKFLQQLLCSSVLSASFLCENIASLLFGFNYLQSDFLRLPVIYNHIPTGVSVKQFVHYIQVFESGDFRQYDYGTGNLLKYGSLEPPSYPVEKISAPIAIFYSHNDWFSVKPDLEILTSKLPNVVDIYTVPSVFYTHLDYLFAKDNKVLLLPKILQLLNKSSSNSTQEILDTVVPSAAYAAVNVTSEI